MPRINYLHTVLFNFKDEVPENERERVVDGIRAQGSLPGVQSIVVAPNVFPHPSLAKFAWAAMLDFADETASLAFRNSAAHREQVARDFTPNRRDFMTLNLHQPFDRTIADNREVGYRHIGMFNFKPEIGEAKRRQVLDAIAEQGRAPGTLRMVIGRNANPNREIAPLEWMVMQDYASVAEHQAYQESPGHRAFVEIFTPARAELVVTDIDLKRGA